MGNISVVINTLNEEKNIERALRSVTWADEAIIVDDGSTDGTLGILEKLKVKSLDSARDKSEKLKVFKHKSKGYVEPARNFAINKASGDWILILDADEEIPDTLVHRLKDIAENLQQIDFVEIPRKNIIFGKWMKASMWWPDYQIRFFKNGAVRWSDKIHIPPIAEGQALKLEPEERWAILHHHYDSIFQFVERMNRYTDVQARDLVKRGYKFDWRDLITKPVGEFLGRFFANRGFEDGLHGLALSLLQAFSFLVMYLRVWEIEKYPQKEIELKNLKEIKNKMGYEINFWFKYGNLSKNPFKRFIQKIGNTVR